MALTTGISTWDAIGRAIEDRLLPARALTALAGFKRLIEDARAMLGAEFCGEAGGGCRSSRFRMMSDARMQGFDPERSLRLLLYCP